MPKMMPNRVKGIAYASITALLWGFLPIVLKVTVERIDAVTISWVRFLIAFLSLVLVFRIRNSAYLSIIKNPPWLLLVGGLALGLNYVAYVYGIDLTSPSNAQIIIQLAPVLLVLAGMLFLKERVTFKQGFGFAIALLGFGFFYNDQLLFSAGQEMEYNWGTIMVVLAALSWVVYALIQKNLVKTYPTQQLNLIIFGAPALILLPLVDFKALMVASSLDWTLLVYMGLNTLVAYGCLAEAFKNLEISKVGIIITLNPIITMVLMYFLKLAGVNWIEPENISIMGLIGAAFIVSGALLAIGKSSSSKTGSFKIPWIKLRKGTL